MLQHQHNPVDWYPWGEEAFARARNENKPIFLSVGYSTCYWCHVMERESFEDEGVAAILNQHFIAIKVDREERPDVDEQYMIATQLATGRGGWPNSVWLTPDGRPWMAGTYFPRDRFKQILVQLDQAWTTQREQIDEQADQFAARIREIGSGAYAPIGRPVDRNLIEQSIREAQQAFDGTHGGFGARPKFPPHGRLRFIADLYRQQGDERLLDMFTGTLDAMALGGIHDHVGGGFHRYATDARWFLPHFEKMLYDNAQLMRVYADGYALTGDERYREVIEDIFTWLRREMTDERGAFCSAIDSEVDAEEGQSYVWHIDEIREVLGPERADLFAEVYGFEARGNFLEEATGHRPGTNIPFLRAALDEEARQRGLDPAKFKRDIARMHAELLAVRDRREQPHLDDKILVSWNALMIEALAYAGRHLDDPRYIEAAVNAAEFIFGRMRRDGRLLRVYRAGEARLPAYLDDYAYLTLACLELHEATDRKRWLDEAKYLAAVMQAKFEDPEDGAFFFMTADHEELILRSKGLTGGGNIPGANGIAARVFLRLAEITGEEGYRETAQRTMNALSGLMWQSVHGNEDLLLAAGRDLHQREFAGFAMGKPEPGAQLHSRAPMPDVRIEGHPVSVGAYASRSSVRAGDEVRIALALDIAEGWHLYAESPGVEFLRPVAISVAEHSEAAVRSFAAVSPRGVRKHDQVFDAELETYSGRTWHLASFKVAETVAPGPLEIELLVHTQACDDRRCLPPETQRVKLALTVATTGGAEAPPRHGALFDALTERER